MGTACEHIDISAVVEPNTDGCEDCLKIGGRWVHLRLCQGCGHVGCCNDSPNKHATAHFNEVGHPVVRSFEPGEDWFWCFTCETGGVIDGAPPAPSHS